MRRLTSKPIVIASTVVLASLSRQSLAEDPVVEAPPTKAATAAPLVDPAAAKPFLGEWRAENQGRDTVLIVSQGPKGDLSIETPAESEWECKVSDIEIRENELMFVENYSVKKRPASRSAKASSVAKYLDEARVESKLTLVAGAPQKLQYSCVAQGMAKPSVNSLVGGGPDLDDGFPYGRFSDEDFDAFVRFAAENDVDIKGAAISRLDANAELLQKFFALALKFDRLDLRARVYAHIVYCLQTNAYAQAAHNREKGTQKLKELVAAIKSQPPEVRQRVIDIIICGPSFKSEEARKEFAEEISRLKDEEIDPTWLLIVDHEYGANDPVFAPWPDRVFEDEGDDQESMD